MTACSISEDSFGHLATSWMKGGVRNNRPDQLNGKFGQLMGRNVIRSCVSWSITYPIQCILRGENMNVKINEDWLATILAFVLLILAMINVITPSLVKF